MSHSYTVAKFGGSSVANVEGVLACTRVVKQSPGVRIVVVSAQAKVTKLLAQLTGQVKNPSEIESIMSTLEQIYAPILTYLSCQKTSVFVKELLLLVRSNAQNYLRHPTELLSDEILSFGERISSRLVTKIFVDEGLNVIHIDARELIKTDSHFGCAKPEISKIKEAVSEKILSLLTQRIVVTEGFIGQDELGQTTTLGLEGSDYSAALFAQAVEAKSLNIWTDVAGLHQVDPRVMKRAKTIREISFLEAAELAAFGAKVLHPSTLFPAIAGNISVFVGSTFQPDLGGTWISEQPSNENSSQILRGMTERKNQILVTLKSSEMFQAKGFLSEVFAVLAKREIDVDLVSASEMSVAFTFDHFKSDNTRLKHELLNELQAIGKVKLTFEENLSLIAVVGRDLVKHKEISEQLLQVVQSYDIQLFNSGVSGNNLSFLVKNHQSQEIIEAVYTQFFSHDTSGVAV